MVEQLKIFANQISERNIEVVRLQQLCKKNKIDHTIPPKVTLPENKAVVPPAKK